MIQRLINNWVYGGFLAGVLLLLLAPLITHAWSWPLTLTFLLLPAYMLHQYEEHDHDRFRLFFNRTIGKGREVLSPLDVFLINIPGVWGVIVLSLYLASYRHLGFGLIAVYLVLVNAVVHLLHALLFRSYNPGLYSALFLFFPLGIMTERSIQDAGEGTLFYQVLGLLIAVGIHAAIIVRVKLRER